jgi:hypothetical protein
MSDRRDGKGKSYWLVLRSVGYDKLGTAILCDGLV